MTVGGQLDSNDTLSSTIVAEIKRDAIERALVIDIDSIRLEVLENDSQFAKVRVLALLRPNFSSPLLLQEATLEARNPVGKGWVVGFLKF